METKTKILFCLAFVTCQLFFWLGVFLIAGYYEPTNQITYTSSIDFQNLINGLRRISFSDIRIVLGYEEFVFLICSFSAAVVFFFTSTQKKSNLRSFLFLIQGFFLYWGWIGIILIPYTLIDGIDGEWLGEHFPIFISAGLWILVSMYFAILSFDVAWIKKTGKRFATE